MAVLAKAKRLCLFHSEPALDDEALDRFLGESRQYLKIHAPTRLSRSIWLTTACGSTSDSDLPSRLASEVLHLIPQRPAPASRDLLLEAACANTRGSPERACIGPPFAGIAHP